MTIVNFTYVRPKFLRKFISHGIYYDIDYMYVMLISNFKWDELNEMV